MRGFGLVVLMAVSLVAVGGCAGAKAYKRGQQALENQDIDRAILELRKAVRESPKNLAYRSELRKAEMKSGQQHLSRGEDYFDRGEHDAAIFEFQLALSADPFLEDTGAARIVRAQRARDGGLVLAEAKRLEAQGDRAGALRASRRALSLDPRNTAAREMLPRLQPLATDFEGLKLPDRPFTLKFANTRLKEAFEVFSQMSGVTFVLDEAVKDETTTLLVQDATFAAALKALLARHRLAAKVADESTVVVYPDTKDKRKQYRELQVETFYLTNLDATVALNLLRGVLDVKGGYVNDALNAIVLRDTPEALAVARQVLEANDLEKPEVLLEIEMLEIDRGKLLKLGVDITPDIAGASIAADPANTASALTLDALAHRFSARNVLVTLPSVVVNLRREDTEARILANPRIRVIDGQQATLHIGERVPFVTVTSLNQVVSENIQFQDVGIKFTATPEVHRDDTVTLKVGLEVSSLGPSTTTASGNTVFRIGTRNAATVLRLKDGETQFLGGLVQEEERTTVAKIPGLGDIPILGVLFASHDRSRVTTDILLSITPRFIRSAQTMGPSEARVWAGQEDDVRSRPDSRSEAAPAPSRAFPYSLVSAPRARRGAEVTVGVNGPPPAAEIELGYDPTVLEFLRLESGGRAVDPVRDSSVGRIRFAAPEGALPLAAVFEALQSGATTVSVRAIPAALPGAAQPDATETSVTVRIEP